MNVFQGNDIGKKNVLALNKFENQKLSKRIQL